MNTKDYEYIMTYSFPCQDLSIAGKQKGMVKGSGTRSGLLWEVERILKECKELPQVLLMENVPQVHSDKNIDDFNRWIEFLHSIGYNNFYQDLNAKDYGIPQNRERCFMVSVLGNYDYCFPVKIKLKKTMFDLIDMNKIDCVIDANNLLRFSEFVCYPQTNGELYNSNYTRVWINRYIGALTCSKMPTVGIEKNGKLYVHKLSTKEAWSFMGFNENDYYKAKKINSEIQLYKQAGNSIVKNVLMAIFNQLF